MYLFLEQGNRYNPKPYLDHTWLSPFDLSTWVKFKKKTQHKTKSSYSFLSIIEMPWFLLNFCFDKLYIQLCVKSLLALQMMYIFTNYKFTVETLFLTFLICYFPALKLRQMHLRLSGEWCLFHRLFIIACRQHIIFWCSKDKI